MEFPIISLLDVNLHGLTYQRLHFVCRFSVKRMILAGIWFGPKKPSMPTFLEPFRTQMNALKRTGKNYIV